MLAELMRLKQCVAIAGTHGKTTTTSLVATLLDAGGLDPTVINGGIINAYGTNARLGAGDWMVVEADESDGTFLKLPADIAIVTNIDPEHLDHFKTFDAIKEAFRAFVENLPFYGFAVMCLDHPTVQELVGKIEDRRVITYGENPAGRRAAGRRRSRPAACRASTCSMRDRKTAQAIDLDDLVLPMPGHHNALNATAAIAVAHRARHVAGANPQGARGLRRRQAALHHAPASGTACTIFDDYGHHPVEIAAVLRAARASTKGKVIAIVQPHRYTRLQSLFDAFRHLLQRRRRRHRRRCLCGRRAADRGRRPRRSGRRDQGARPSQRAWRCRRRKMLPAMIREIATPGDYVVFLGAGNITQWAYALPGQLAAGGAQ